MKNLLWILTFSLFLFACVSKSSFEIAYTISEKDIIPEGIAFSKATNSFFISSILKNKILRIDAKSGDYSDFITPDIFDMSFLGMMVDENRNHLWACGNNSIDNMNISTLSCYDVKSGDLLKWYEYSDSARTLFNDLCIDHQGNIYITNTFNQSIYKLDIEKDSLEVFYYGSEIIYPNGISISDDDKLLYVASNDYGIQILNIAEKEIIGEADSSVISTGIDGLKFYKNSIYGLMNAVKDPSEVKICKYFLDESLTRITSMKVLDQNNPNFQIPTTLVIANNRLFCLANSQMGNVDFNTRMINDESALRDVIILKYSLKK